MSQMWKIVWWSIEDASRSRDMSRFLHDCTRTFNPFPAWCCKILFLSNLLVMMIKYFEDYLRMIALEYFYY